MGLHWSEKEALRAQYPEFWLDLLFEVVALVDSVERRELSSHEATTLAKARFSVLMAEHLPACQAQVESYRERTAAERRKLTDEAAAVEERRVRAQRAESLRLEQAAKDRNAEIYANAREAELRQREQWHQKYDEEEKLRREKNEKEQVSAEVQAKEGARLLAEIETGGKGK